MLIADRKTVNNNRMETKRHLCFGSLTLSLSSAKRGTWLAGCGPVREGFCISSVANSK